MNKPDMHPHAAVLLALGGQTAVARHLGLNVVATVGKWPRRGIPPEYWPDLCAWAAERNVPGINSDVLLAGKRAARAARKAGA